MSCDCNTPTSGGQLPANPSAYLTNPVTAPAESCYTPPENPCAVPVSRRRYLVDYIPGWLQKLTGAAKGKMLIGVGDTLHFFKGDNPGPLYFDGHDVSVGEQSTLTTKANEGAIVERGFLTLAKKVRRGKVLPNGSVADVDYFEYGVQAVREVSSGELLGLTIDPASGAVRKDVIQPTERNLITKGFPEGMRRLGFIDTLIDGACGKVPAKEFLSYRGGVYGDDEILADHEKGGLPAILIPRNEGSQKTHVLGTQKYVPVEGVTAESLEAGEYRIPVIKPVYGDAGCPDKITAYITEYIPFPAILTSDYGSDYGTAYETLLDDPVSVYSTSKTSGAVLILDETILPPELVPEDADYLIYSIYAKANATAGSGTRTTTVNFTFFDSADSSADQFVRIANTASTSSSLSGILGQEVKAFTFTAKNRTGGCKLTGNLSTISAGSGGSNLAELKIFLVGYGKSGIEPTT
jgi:hypothetical protein